MAVQFSHSKSDVSPTREHPIRTGVCCMLITIDTGSFTLLKILKSWPTVDISGSPITNYLPLKLREYCQTLSTLLKIKLN